MKAVRIKNNKLNESNINETFYIAVYFLNREGNVIDYDDTRVWYKGTIEDARNAIYDVTVGNYNELTDKILNAYYALSDIQAGMVNACQLILCDENHKPIDKSVFLSWKKLARATTESYSGRNRVRVNENNNFRHIVKEDYDVEPGLMLGREDFDDEEVFYEYATDICKESAKEFISNKWKADNTFNEFKIKCTRDGLLKHLDNNQIREAFIEAEMILMYEALGVYLQRQGRRLQIV